MEFQENGMSEIVTFCLLMPSCMLIILSTHELFQKEGSGESWSWKTDHTFSA